MKYLSLLGIIAVIVLCVFTLFSGISQADLRVSAGKHNLSLGGNSANFKFYTFQVCVFCHTPHAANKNVKSNTSILNGVGHDYDYSGSPMLLWNRELANATSTYGGSYEVYTGSDLQADNSRVRSYSLLCLSCHDGVGALNVLSNFPSDGVDTSAPFGVIDPFGGSSDQIGDIATGINGDEPMEINIGGRVVFTGATDDKTVDLRDDHPISFDYTQTLADNDGALHGPNGDGTVGANNLPLFWSTTTSNYTSLECSTCHDVHDQGSQVDHDYPFLTMSNENSALCLNCHIK